MNQGSITQGTLHGALKMCLENDSSALKSVKSANYILLDREKSNLDFDPGILTSLLLTSVENWWSYEV